MKKPIRTFIVRFETSRNSTCCLPRFRPVRGWGDLTARRRIMGIKKYKPTAAARGLMTVSDFAEITKDRPEKNLTAPMKRSGGRNVHGHITRRHQGGGHKRRYRIIDFKRRDKDGVPAKVAAIEYDPNRTVNIALLHYADGEKRYILSPSGLTVGDTLYSGSTADIRPGNSLPLQN